MFSTNQPQSTPHKGIVHGRGPIKQNTRCAYRDRLLRRTSRRGKDIRKNGIIRKVVLAYCATTRQNFGLPDGNGSETTCGSLVCRKDCVVTQLVVLREAIC